VEFPTDRSLQVRMAATLLLLVLVPPAFVVTLTTALNVVVLPLAERLLEAEYGRLPVEPLWAFGLGLAGLAVAYVAGERAVLRSMGARRVDAEAAPGLHARVDRLAATAGVPTPDVAVVDSEVPNAFAAGRSPETATVGVTEGLRETLDDDELDAVLAHELAHVRNRDAAVMTVAYALPTVTYLVLVTTYRLLAVFVEGFRHADFDGDSAKGAAALVVLFVATALVTLAVSALFWVASGLLFRLLSRYREYAADRGAAAVTGDPTALASALATIDEDMAALPDEDLRELDGGVEALYVSSLDVPMFDRDHDGVLSQELFPESHPPTAERVERLQDLAADLETTAR